MKILTRSLLLAAALLAHPLPATAQGGPSPRVRAAVHDIETMLMSAGDSALDAFAQTRLAPSYRARFSGDSLTAHLRALRSAIGQVGGVSVRRDSAFFYMEIDGQRGATVRFSLDEPGRITSLDLLPGGRDATPSVWTGVTWESLPAVVQQAAAAGFNGAIVARRNGVEALRTAVGLADPATGRRTALNTVFAIGSQPMDFTKTAILLLAQRGRLELDDSIGRFLGDVPADKRGITIRHLLNGASGLVDMYHDESKDWHSDLSWIPREEAVRRMMTSTLRFPPGTARLPSHAAYNLLAVIVEEASGTSYPDFLRREILQPLGMTRTGFNGETLGLSLDQFAVGGGPGSVGLPNVPPNWGPTSWLVMGSGGMVSTVEDMDRYYSALANGTILTGDWAAMQQGPSAGAGGSGRGYFILHVTDGAGSSVLLLTNTPGPVRNTPAMTAALERLVQGT